MTYAEKLRDPRWQKKRLQILERDGWRCFSCKSTTKTLNVHHLIYAKRDPWDYPDHCYQTLCDGCHEIRGELTNKSADAFRISLGTLPTEKMEVAAGRMMALAMEGIK